MFWLGGVFAALWASVNLVVYAFYKMNGFVKPLAVQTASPG